MESERKRAAGMRRERERGNVKKVCERRETSVRTKGSLGKKVLVIRQSVKFLSVLLYTGGLFPGYMPAQKKTTDFEFFPIRLCSRPLPWSLK